jgi:hypothetical protein
MEYGYPVCDASGPAPRVVADLLVAKLDLRLCLFDRGFAFARRLTQDDLHFGFIEWF